MAQAKPAASAASDVPDYLQQYVGEGLDTIGQNMMSQSYLTILQDKSDAIVQKVPGAEPGVFFNTGSQDVLGPEVRVIILATKTVWDEKDQGGRTVERYEPHGIEVTEIRPPVGGKGFTQMVNPKTQNKVIETFAYAVVLADRPQAGLLMLTAGLGSMKAFKRLNRLLTETLFPNSADHAPIYAKIWKLRTGVKTSKTVNTPYYALEDVQDDGWVPQELFGQAILPAKAIARQGLLAAPVGEESAVVSDTE